VNGPTDFWREMEGAGPASVTVGGVELTRGSRVLVTPRTGGDVLDLALAGRVGVVAGVEQDFEGKVHLAVTFDDDPGRDLGDARFLGHRFFFSPDEVEPLGYPLEERPQRRILVAGIGNIFLGDDGFGVEVVKRLHERDLPPGVEVVDFGIRGMDLAYALGAGYEVAIFVDLAARGEAPGTLSVIEPELAEDEVTLETHAMDPVKVLRLARELGPLPARTLVVACEPQRVMTGAPDEDVVVELSEPVRAAVEGAVDLVERLVADLARAEPPTGEDDEVTRKVVNRWASS
jgi:hydrogenase maturation protease